MLEISQKSNLSVEHAIEIHPKKISAGLYVKNYLTTRSQSFTRRIYDFSAVPGESLHQIKA
jgi:hypothetical protein